VLTDSYNKQLTIIYLVPVYHPLCKLPFKHHVDVYQMLHSFPVPSNNCDAKFRKVMGNARGFIISEIEFDRVIKKKNKNKKSNVGLVKHLTSREFIGQVTSDRTIGFLFNLLLCLRGKWKDKRVGFIRQWRFSDDRRVCKCYTIVIPPSYCPPN